MEKYTKLFNLFCVGVIVVSSVTPVMAIESIGVQTVTTSSVTKELDEITKNSQDLMKPVVDSLANKKAQGNAKYINAIDKSRLDAISKKIHTIKKGDSVSLQKYLATLSKPELLATVAGVLLPYEVNTTTTTDKTPAQLGKVTASFTNPYRNTCATTSVNATVADSSHISLFDYHFRMYSCYDYYTHVSSGNSDFVVQPYIDNIFWIFQEGPINYKTCGVISGWRYRCVVSNSVFVDVGLGYISYKSRIPTYFGAYRDWYGNIYSFGGNGSVPL